MDELLKRIINAAGIPGYESQIAGIMRDEFKKRGMSPHIDSFGNVIAKKGKGRKKIMLAAHMDEVGLVVRHISKEGFLSFVKVGGIDDRVLAAQRVIVKSAQGDCLGIIGTKPPHLLKEEERKQPLKYEDMFIDIGCKTKEEALKKVDVGDAVIFEPNAGVLNNNLYYGKAIDDRAGCYALLKIMERISANIGAEVYAVATAQEEVGLKGARTSAFKIDPDFALAIDTTVSGDIPAVSEKQSVLRLGAGVAITIMEASGRGLIVNETIKNLLIDTARKNKIKYQIDIIDGGMTDGAMIYMNREGVPTGVLSLPTRYIHASTGVFCIDDLNQAVNLAVKTVEEMAKTAAEKKSKKV